MSNREQIRTKEIDARGLVCPEPVLRTRRVIAAESPAAFNILVDNPAAEENVIRFLSSQGYDAKSIPIGKEFRIFASSVAATGKQTVSRTAIIPSSESKKILVLIATDRMGQGDDRLGKKLLETYIKTLKELGSSLWQLIFVNGGVRLTCDDSAVLPAIKEYEAAGVVVLSCGTCMEHFGLTGKKAVGGLTNMLDIVMATQNADKVITIH